MDRNSKENAEIQELIRRSQASRVQLSMDVSTLKQRLDVPNQVRHSLMKSPTKWLLGSLGAGIATSFLFKGKKKNKKPKKERSLPLKLIALTLTAARPLVKVWLTGQLKRWVAQTYASQQSPFTIEPPAQNVRPSGSRPR